MRKRFVSILAVLLKPAVALGGAIVIAAVAVGVAWLTSSVIPSGHYTPAVEAPITAVGGASSDLSFQVSGQIAAIPVSIGQEVSAGTALIELDRSSLLAARAGAAANQEAAAAKLAALKAGTRPEQLAVDQTAVVQAQELLRDAVRSTYINADGAIHTTADQFFLNPRSVSATLSFTFSDQTLKNTVQQERIALEPVLIAWGAQVNTAAFAASDPLEDATLAQANLAQVSAFLDNAAAALEESMSSSVVPLTTLQSYQTAVTAARLSISGSASTLTGAVTALQSAQGALTLAQAGPTVHDIAAAQAAVDAAQAALDGIDVSLRESTLIAPVAGTITALNAHLGQTVAPGQIIASVESSGGSKPSALVVPTSSVIENGGQAFVYVKSGVGAPVKTTVTTGLVSAGGMTEITSGLSTGEEVLTFGIATST